MAGKIDCVWLLDGSTGVAHLCAVNTDEGKFRAAAVCSTISGANVWKAVNPNSRRCEKCANIDASGDEIVFVMPNDGRRVVVRERRR
jgi:hypothetical protein